jgi:hypothetical protein
MHVEIQTKLALFMASIVQIYVQMKNIKRYVMICLLTMYINIAPNIYLNRHYHEKIRSDELIGQVKFGVGAIQEAEVDMWGKCINTPGEEIVDWLYLIDNEWICKTNISNTLNMK